MSDTAGASFLKNGSSPAQGWPHQPSSASAQHTGRSQLPLHVPAESSAFLQAAGCQHLFIQQYSAIRDAKRQQGGRYYMKAFEYQLSQSRRGRCIVYHLLHFSHFPHYVINTEQEQQEQLRSRMLKEKSNTYNRTRRSPSYSLGFFQKDTSLFQEDKTSQKLGTLYFGCITSFLHL